MTKSHRSIWTLCPNLFEKDPTFGASVIGRWEAGVGLNTVLGKDLADVLTNVGSAGAYKGQDGRS